MLRVLYERLRQKHRTIAWPKREPTLPDRMRGRPTIDAARCPESCAECVAACPTGAIQRREGRLEIDLGRCLFCDDCVRACSHGAITFRTEYRMAVRQRKDLVIERHIHDGLTAETGMTPNAERRTQNAEQALGNKYPLARALERESRRLFGRSLKLRQVSAGGCNACEADVNVLNTVVFDLGRFGVQFVASPRHADGLLITGPVSQNMRLALEKTYAAVPAPKIVIAVGACAISGGPYIGHPECCNGADPVLPVDLYIPGCPPHPMTTLDGIVRLLGRL